MDCVCMEKSRATAFIGQAIEALPLVGALGIPAYFVATHPEVAAMNGLEPSFLIAALSGS